MSFAGKKIKMIEGQFGPSSDYAVLIGEDGKAIGKFNPDDQITLKEIVRRWNAYEEFIETMDSLLRFCVTPNGMPDANKGRTQEQQKAFSKAIKLLTDSRV